MKHSKPAMVGWLVTIPLRRPPLGPLKYYKRSRPLTAPWNTGPSHRKRCRHQTWINGTPVNYLELTEVFVVNLDLWREITRQAKGVNWFAWSVEKFEAGYFFHRNELMRVFLFIGNRPLRFLCTKKSRMRQGVGSKEKEIDTDYSDYFGRINGFTRSRRFISYTRFRVRR